MKITLVTETFPPEINGVAMTLSHVVEGLAERGHAVSVVRPRQSADDQPRRAGSITEHLVRGFPLPGYPLLKLGFPATQQLRDRWKLDRPDLVHVATEGPLGYSALRAARDCGCLLTSSFHTNFHHYGRHYGAPFVGPAALAYLRHFHNRTLATFAPTVELNTALGKSGFRNLRLLARGVDTRLFTPAARSDQIRLQHGASAGDLLVIHVSRLAAEKNYSLLLESFRALQRVRPDAKLAIVGDGPLRRHLQRENPDVSFTGFVPRTELAAHYASADLFLYPSLTETFGNVVLEGLASGLAVVAFDYAAAARFIRHETNGVLVPFGNRAAFVAAAVATATESARAQVWGSAARRTAETIPWSEVLDGFDRDLRAIVAANRRAAVPVLFTP